jgi:WD40 repeat protein
VVLLFGCGIHRQIQRNTGAIASKFGEELHKPSVFTYRPKLFAKSFIKNFCKILGFQICDRFQQSQYARFDCPFPLLPTPHSRPGHFVPQDRRHTGAVSNVAFSPATNSDAAQGCAIKPTLNLRSRNSQNSSHWRDQATRMPQFGRFPAVTVNEISHRHYI